jgi:transposase-like protein
MASRRKWQCKGCRKQFSVKVGTIFEDSPLPLSKWLPAMWLIANAKNGISSCELSRSLGVTQKTAWFMLHRIRLVMQNGTLEMLGDDVEVDETYIGGKARNMHADVKAKKITGRGGKDKAVVMGMLERGGDVVLKHIDRPKKKTLEAIINTTVMPGSRVYTDALRSYDDLGNWYRHQVIDHSVAYVEGLVHTNGLENFWSCLKRTIGGTYVSVEPFHLHRYLDEQAFRFNERKGSDSSRFIMALSNANGRRLTYAKLTGKESGYLG